MKIDKLRKSHAEYIARCKRGGAKTLPVACPHCDHQQDTLAAPAGETWDSIETCLGCGQLYFKITIGQTEARGIARTDP